MKKINLNKWVWFGMLTCGCLDLDLLDDMHPSDGGALDETGAPSTTSSSKDGDGPPLPEADPSDEVAPRIMAAACGEPERAENNVCLIDGPVSAAARFSTDEPAEVSLSDEMVGLSEAWSTEHLVIFKLDTEETSTRLEVSDINGNTATVQLVLRRNDDRSPVVITEIHADPFGAEPAQEYIEIKNVGSAPVDLSGWMIDDNGDRNGDLISTGTELGADEIALIVSESYDPLSETDPQPDPGARMIRLEGSLVSNGLKNSLAESVELYDADGRLASRFDGSIGLGSEGESLHRRHELVPPLAPNAFGIIKPATPGKSP